MDQEKQKKAWARIIAKCWSDPQFKQRFIEDPKGVLEAEGISNLSEDQIEVHETPKECAIW